jgi:hypothetical protein
MLVPESSRLTDFGLDVATVDKARLAASRQLREAISVRYVCPQDIDSFPTSVEGEELRALVEQHGVALAAASLSQHDGGRSRKVDAEWQTARKWLDDVKAGRADLSNVLPRRSRRGSPQRQLVTLDGGDSELRDDFWPGGRRRKDCEGTESCRPRRGEVYLC